MKGETDIRLQKVYMYSYIPGNIILFSTSMIS